ncbi:MAG: hypothetical protein LBU87_01210, partial [Lactobacillales bacterium]|nr:hypothetical protein [Lactobacillales bacterium]
TRNKEKEKKEILKKSVGEIAFLKKESAAKLHDRIAHKIQSVDFRLKIIEENSRRELKNQMLRILMQKANALLAQDQKLKTAHNIDQSIDKICDALDHRLN